jgi:RNA polymerase sigma-70 factor (ECF subfamily)
MKNHLANARDYAQAQKRDARKVVPLDGEAAESRYSHEPVEHATPENIYERQWALTLLNTVTERLRNEFVEEGHGELFQQLSFCLAGERSAVPYAELAPRLRLSEGALRVAVHRLRQRYRQLLQNEIAQTVAEPGEVKEELLHLLKVVAG